MNSHQSTPDKTLALSFRLLTDWETTQNFDLILAEQRKFDNSEITDMAAATCRSFFRNKHYSDWLLQTRSKKMPRGRIKRIIGIAVTQLLEKQIEPSIICDTAVRFCKQKYSKYDASFINQFLRSLTAEELPKPNSKVELGLSPELLKHWRKHFSDHEVRKFAETLKSPVPMTARLSPENPDISDLMDFIKPLDLPEWSNGIKAFEISNAKEFLKHNNNRLYIQDPAPLMAIQMLKPQEGETLADLCSAPGGKSLLIAQLLKNSGKLISADVSKKRLEQVRENLDAYSNCEIMQMDARNPDIEEQSLDGILLDVPCSNTGVIRRKADVRWTFNQKKLKEITELQYEILVGASKLLKPGGRIIYSTCSICPEENIAIVKRFTDEHKSFSLESHKTLFPESNHDGSFACKITLNT